MKLRVLRSGMVLLGAGLVFMMLMAMQLAAVSAQGGSGVPLPNDYRFWYHVGSKNEKPGKTGFAHLFEHLMFGGSEHVEGSYIEAMERIGATDLKNPNVAVFSQFSPKAVPFLPGQTKFAQMQNEVIDPSFEKILNGKGDPASVLKQSAGQLRSLLAGS